jgi:hypothetical protein
MFEGNVGGNRYGIYSVLLLLKLLIGAWTYLASCQQVGLCHDLSVAHIYAKDRWSGCHAESHILQRRGCWRS